MSKKEHLWSVIGHYGVVPFSYFCHQFLLNVNKDSEVKLSYT